MRIQQISNFRQYKHTPNLSFEGHKEKLEVEIKKGKYVTQYIGTNGKITPYPTQNSQMIGGYWEEEPRSSAKVESGQTIHHKTEFSDCAEQEAITTGRSYHSGAKIAVNRPIWNANKNNTVKTVYYSDPNEIITSENISGCDYVVYAYETKFYVPGVGDIPVGPPKPEKKNPNQPAEPPEDDVYDKVWVGL